MMSDELHRKGSVNEEHYRGLERMYLRGANINAFFEPGLTVSEGAAEVRMRISPKLFHAAGAVHGSVYFKALDDAAFFAANSLVEDVFVLTSSFHIQLLRPVTEGELIARGTVVSSTRNLIVADAVLEDDRKRLVAKGTGSFMRSRIKLVDVPGYLPNDE